MFSDINASQGSAATYLMCGGIFTSFLESVSVKEFKESVNI